MDFTTYFQKFPQKFSELTVLKDIHHTAEFAEYELEENKEGKEHERIIVELYMKVCEYLREKGIDPDNY